MALPNRYEHPEWNDPSLFLALDESWIDSSDGADFKFCPLEKNASPILFPDQTWEGGEDGKPRPVHADPFLANIVRDVEDGRYLLWYNSMNIGIGRTSDPGMEKSGPITVPGRGSRICFATSSDGLRWEKPDLGLVSYHGNTRNNMVPLPGSPLLSDHLSAVFPTRHEGAATPLAASIYSTFPDPVYHSGITQMFSTDGFRWDLHYPPTLPLDGDAHCVSWDANTQTYLCTTRSAQHTRIATRFLKRGIQTINNKRHVALAQSRDLLHWTPFLDILEADDEDPENAQLYQMYIVPYGNLYIGFVEVFYMGREMSTGPLEIQLAISHDLVNWKRAGRRQPFLARGEAGSWDASHVIPTNNPPFAEGDRLRFWYSGSDAEHWQLGHSALSTGTIRRDGFARWHTEGEGSLTTVPLDIRWASWPEVNVDASTGAVWMEILDEAGHPLPGLARENFQAITGDHVRATCRFDLPRGTFLRHTGKVRLRFHLRNASLYAVRAPNVRMDR